MSRMRERERERKRARERGSEREREIETVRVCEREKLAVMLTSCRHSTVCVVE